MLMFRKEHMILRLVLTGTALLCMFLTQAQAGQTDDHSGRLSSEKESLATVSLEDLVLKGSEMQPMEGFASYYASRFEGRRTASGHRYNPEKMTGAHQSLPLGTVVRVVNPATNQEVHVTITDRCAKKAYHFIDLSRAAAKKIGLWGKGKIRVIIHPFSG